MCQALIAALRKLPEGVDLLRLRKMPANVGGRPNPLALLGRIGSCSLNGNLIVVGDDFEVYRTLDQANAAAAELARLQSLSRRERSGSSRMSTKR